MLRTPAPLSRALAITGTIVQYADINWGSVADWVSGLGSFSAVVAALYLSRESQRIRLTGYCGLRTILGGGLPTTETVSIGITNVGSRSTVISNIGMRVGTFKKRFAVITLVKDPFSAGLPLPLNDGQVGHWGIPLNEQKEWLVELCRDFVKTSSDIRTLRFVVYTTNGGHTILRPELPLRQELKKIQERSDG